MARSITIACLLFLLLSAPGCLGRFALTGSVRKFNMDVSDDKWVREVTFVGLYVVPVYPFCAGADLFVVNSIEFWSGKNPVSGDAALLSKAWEGDNTQDSRLDQTVASATEK